MRRGRCACGQVAWLAEGELRLRAADGVLIVHRRECCAPVGRPPRPEPPPGAPAPPRHWTEREDEQ
jgi:hypothetical protein